MSQESNKNVAKKALDLWNTGNMKTLDDIYAPNCVFHQHHHPQSHQDIKGTTAWKQFIHEFREAFPDYQDTIEDQIAEGNKVVTRFTSRGTQRGEFMGIPPTNKKVVWTGIAIYRIENSKIVESWVNWDMYGALEQMGAVSLHAAS